MKHRTVIYEDLLEFVVYARTENKKISLNEFIRKKYNLEKKIIADLSKIEFNEKNPIDLSDLNLSGSDLRGIKFSAKYVILQGTDLRGANLDGVEFVDGINLARTKLGGMTLKNRKAFTKIFKECQLSELDYNPANTSIIMISPTEEQINEYLSTDKKKSFNDFLQSSSSYPLHFKLIADFSGMTIDERFCKANLSGSNLENSTITGNIDGLILRDCITRRTIFDCCELIDVDLRGTSLATNSVFGWGYEAAIFKGNVRLTNPKFSFGSEHLDEKASVNHWSFGSSDPCVKKNLDRAFNVGLLPPEGLYDLTVLGNPIFDSCYKRGSNSNKLPYIKCDKEIFNKYLENCLLISPKRKSFIEFVRTEYSQKGQNIEGDFVADFAGIDLSNLPLLKSAIRNMDFENCNFSYCNLSGNCFDHARFNNCNFSGALFSERNGVYNLARSFADYLPTFFTYLPNVNVVSLRKVEMINCDLSYAIANQVVFTEAKLINLNAINLIADRITLEELEIANINFSGAWLAYGKLIHISRNSQDKGTKFDSATCKEVEAENCDLSGASFIQSNLERSRIKHSNLDNSYTSEANARSSIISGTSMNGAVVNRTDISGATIIPSSEDGLILIDNKGIPQEIDIDWNQAVKTGDSLKAEKEQCVQEKNKEKRNYYNLCALYLVTGFSLLQGATYVGVHSFSPLVASITLANPAILGISAAMISLIVIDRFVATDMFRDNLNKIPLLKKTFDIFKIDFSNGIGITEKIADVFKADKFFKAKPKVRDLSVQLDNIRTKIEVYEQAIRKVIGYEYDIKVQMDSKIKSLSEKTRSQNIKPSTQHVTSNNQQQETLEQPKPKREYVSKVAPKSNLSLVEDKSIQPQRNIR